MSNIIQDQIVSTASSFLGKQSLKNDEGQKNISFKDKVFESKLKGVGWSSGSDWCAYFAKLVWKDAYTQANPKNKAELLSKINSLGGGSNANWVKAKSLGIEVSSIPKIGSIAVYTNAKNKQMTWKGHTAIVIQISQNGITTIEGNTTSDNGTKGSMYVERKFRSYSAFGRPYLENQSVAKSGKWRYLRGFIHPPEAEFEEEIEEVVPTEEEVVRKDTTNKDVVYVFTRDVGILSDQSGIGDKDGLIIEFNDDFTLDDFLAYKGETLEKTNREYIEDQQLFIEDDDEDDKDLIKSGTVVAIPFKNVIRDDTGIDISETNSNNYTDPEYISHKSLLSNIAVNFAPSLFTYTDGDVTQTKNKFSVWIFCKALNKIIDVSQFVYQMDINATKKVNSFNFLLADSDDLSNKIISNYVYLKNMKSAPSFFYKSISVNDLVFIQLDEPDTFSSIQGEVDFSQLANRNYELIGLVDSCVERKLAERNEVSIYVSGRDLSKTFEDDEALFFPKALTQNANGQMIVGTSESGTNLLRRTFATGRYDMLFGKDYESIRNIFRFYLDLLQNIGYVPESLNDTFFSSYVDEKGNDRRIKSGSKSLAKGVYQIIYLAVDTAIADRRVIDSNVGNPEGPFSSLFDRVCQEPFVEYFTDTYRDLFGIVVRQPPFTEKSLKEIVENQLFFEINDKLIVDKNLIFSEEVYTWFQLDVQGLAFGSSNKVSLEYCPIVQLDEYVNLWGSKRFSVVHNYRNAVANEDSKTIVNFNTFRKQAIDDLMYLVEIHSYLPFTRSGTIVLGVVDKRIRKGTFIKLGSTNELFYVDAVQHNLNRTVDSTDGYTVLTVSRGMIVDYIIGKQTDNQEASHGYSQMGTKGQEIDASVNIFKYRDISYFNVINTALLRNSLYQHYYVNKEPDTREHSGSIVNKRIFDFFIQRKQFE